MKKLLYKIISLCQFGMKSKNVEKEDPDLDKLSSGCSLFTKRQQLEYGKFLNENTGPLLKVDISSLGFLEQITNELNTTTTKSHTGGLLKIHSLSTESKDNTKLIVSALIPYAIAIKMAENHNYALYCLSFLKNAMLRKADEKIGLFYAKNITFNYSAFTNNIFCDSEHYAAVEVRLNVET